MLKTSDTFGPRAAGQFFLRDLLMARMARTFAGSALQRQRHMKTDNCVRTHISFRSHSYHPYHPNCPQSANTTSSLACIHNSQLPKGFITHIKIETAVNPGSSTMYGMLPFSMPALL